MLYKGSSNRDGEHKKYDLPQEYYDGQSNHVGYRTCHCDGPPSFLTEKCFFF